MGDDIQATLMTISEIIVVMAISLTLFAIGSLTFIKPQQQANLDSSFNTLISDIKSQQTISMSSDSTLDHGIHFESDKYVLFEGSSYNPVDSSNFEVVLEDQVRITNINLTNQNLLFAKGSGETGITNEINILDITQDQNGEVINLSINQYGAITKE